MPKFIDITGRRFDKLEVVEIAEMRILPKGQKVRMWKCRCDCGKEILAYKDYLEKKTHTPKSCGCAYADELRKEIGKRNGLLEIIDVIQRGRVSKIVVRCDCGTVKEMVLSRFHRDTSCGCARVLRGDKNRYYKHGMSKMRIHKVYRHMYARCYNENSISYPNYGGRGIKLCDEWLGEHGAENFIKWAYANGYDENAERGKCTLDRIDNDGNYEPSNCRWITMLEQSNNTRSNRCFEIDGVTKTLSEWCREYGNVCVQSVWRRVKKGMDIKTALTKPMRKNRVDMTEEELMASKNRGKELCRKWHKENSARAYEVNKAWKERNIEKVRAYKRKYEEKKKLERLKSEGLLAE